MKKFTFIFMLFTFLVLQSSSCKDPFVPDYPSFPFRYKTNLKFVWIKPIYQDTSTVIQSELFFTGDYVAMGIMAYLPEDKDKGLALFHRMTGAKHPNWPRDPCCILEGNAKEFEDLIIGGLQNEVALLSESSRLYAYDVPSGQKKWTYGFPVHMCGDIITSFGDKVYLPYWPGYTWTTLWARMVRYDIQTGFPEELFTVNAVPNYDLMIMSPITYVDANNDTLLISQSQHYNFSNHAKMLWLHCYNATQKTMKWENKTFSSDNEASRNEMFIMENGKVLIQTMRAIFCIDIETGAVVWAKEGMVLSLNLTKLLYEDGRVYSRFDDGKLYCWDAETGAEIWRNTQERFAPIDKENMVIYNGKLYFSSYGPNALTYLNCVCAETGRFLWRDPGPMGKMNGFLVLDKNMGYLYGQLSSFVYCIDLNRTEIDMVSE